MAVVCIHIVLRKKNIAVDNKTDSLRGRQQGCDRLLNVQTDLYCTAVHTYIRTCARTLILILRRKFSK